MFLLSYEMIKLTKISSKQRFGRVRRNNTCSCLKSILSYKTSQVYYTIEIVYF